MTDTTSRAGKAGVQAVEFALDILEYVAQQGATVGVSELARAFGTSKNRIHRHLQTLVSTGYLLRDSETERYGISARLMALGHAVSESFEISSAARQVAEELRDALGHAVAISQPEPGGSRIVMLVRNRSNIEIAVKPGSLLEYHASAQGKITLAFGPPTLLEAVLASDLSHLTPYTITAPERLRHEIEQVRRQGWACAPNEVMIGLNALAAPIFSGLGQFIGAIALTDSVQFIPEVPTSEQVHALLAAAGRISANLGYREPRRRT